MPNKYRKGGVKAEHTIVSGIGNLLQLVASCPYVHSVMPGRISRSSTGPSKPQLVFQYFQPTGLKLLGKTSTAVQEVFVVSSQSQEAYDWLISRQIITSPSENKSNNKKKQSRKRNGKKKSKTSSAYELTEASEMTLQRYLELMRIEAAQKPSPWTEDEQEQLRQLRKELEAAEKHKQGTKQTKQKQQTEKKTQYRFQKAKPKGSAPKQKQSQKQQSKHPPETMEDWLAQTASISEEQWEQLLRRFGKIED